LSQDLTAVGSKQWGSWWDGRGLLKVKIYDFALYTNAQSLRAVRSTSATQATSSSLPPVLDGSSAAPDADAAPRQPPTLAQQPMFASAQQARTPRAFTADAPDDGEGDTSDDETAQPGRRRRRQARRAARRERRQARADAKDFCKSIGEDNAVEMSLCVRPARDIPLGILRSEYQRILKKRLKSLGGDPEDPSLSKMMKYFDPAELPSAATRGRCIRKGTPIHFSRTKKGALTAVAAGETLATVESDKLCAAVFDLYLGDMPVSKKAKESAGQAFHSMLQDQSQPLSLTI
jgi:Chalcone isomerase like